MSDEKWYNGFGEEITNPEQINRLVACAKQQNAAAFVLRTVPFESADCSDPVTLEPYTAFNDAFAVCERALKAVGGVDHRMRAAAATDLVLRLKTAKETVLYAPECAIETNVSFRPSYLEQLISGMMLRLRYGSRHDVKDGVILCLKALKHPDAYGVNRGALVVNAIKSVLDALGVLIGRVGKYKALKNTVCEWYGAWLGLSRGEFCIEQEEQKPLVSILTRTRKRPETLRKTLESLRHQTYQNFEIVVVEDGPPDSERMIREDFSDLPIRYHATVENVGRAAAFNVGVSLACGEYLNMLDDDDFLMPEHLELCVAKAVHSGVDMVFSRCIAYEVTWPSREPYCFEVKNRRLLDFPRLEPFTMVRRCLTTNHAVLFKKSLCEAVSGMREYMHAHEDWNLWLRLMAVGSYTVLPYATCCYIVPFDKAQEQARLAGYAKYDDMLLEPDTMLFDTSEEALLGYQKSVYDDYAYLDTLGLLGERLHDEAETAQMRLQGVNDPCSFEKLAGQGAVTLSAVQLRELYDSQILVFRQWEQEGVLSERLRAKTSV